MAGRMKLGRGYTAMIRDTIDSLEDKTGPEEAIFEKLGQLFPVEGDRNNVYRAISIALQRGVAKGEFKVVKVSPYGPNFYKNGTKPAVKKAAKKPAAKKAAKKPAAKKAAKKPALKKAVKKPAAKKVAKKSSN